MAAERLDCVVLGAGVVGLACARALALAGREVLLLEATEGIGTGTSSRNSEVIHAGIYYPTGSLKARFCVEGRERLYAYCAERGIPFARLGKLIVAADEAEMPTLGTIRAKAAANGVDLVPLAAAEARVMEPQLRCAAALHSPTTGIVDSHALMLALQGDAEEAGALAAFHARVEGGAVADGGVLLRVAEEGGSGAEATELHARAVVNAIGLHAPDLARSIQGIPRQTIPHAYLCKGNYYTLLGRAPFSRLIYPVPEAAGLGVHLTLDLGGQARFGPDTEWVEREDYDVDPARAEGFYAAIRRYWPALPDSALAPGYAGIRPKISGPGEPNADFRVSGPAEHGIGGLVNLYGIESPGLTASLALADHVAAIIGGGNAP